MKANNLIIGDWVLEENKIAQITSANLYCMDCKKNNSDVKPIPITSKILENIGFKNYKFSWTENHSWIYYDFEKKEIHNESDVIVINELSFKNRKHNWSVDFSIYNRATGTLFIDYVHELQHLFRLCGIDKEIEL